MEITATSRKFSVKPEWKDVILGIWLAISPFALGFRRDLSGVCNNVCVGIGIAALAALSGRGTGALRGLIIILAAWVFIAPFLLGFSTTAYLWNNVGAAFLIITGAAISEGLHPTYHASANMG